MSRSCVLSQLNTIRISSSPRLGERPTATCLRYEVWLKIKDSETIAKISEVGDLPIKKLLHQGLCIEDLLIRVGEEILHWDFHYGCSAFLRHHNVFDARCKLILEFIYSFKSFLISALLNLALKITDFFFTWMWRWPNQDYQLWWRVEYLQVKMKQMRQKLLHWWSHFLQRSWSKLKKSIFSTNARCLSVNPVKFMAAVLRDADS